MKEEIPDLSMEESRIKNFRNARRIVIRVAALQGHYSDNKETAITIKTCFSYIPLYIFFINGKNRFISTRHQW
jgi:hypothetical protein